MQWDAEKGFRARNYTLYICTQDNQSHNEDIHFVEVNFKWTIRSFTIYQSDMCSSNDDVMN